MNTIIGPGFYRLRNGCFAEVVYKRGDRWYGHDVYNSCGKAVPSNPTMWDENGRWRGLVNKTDWDIVGPAEVTVLI